MFRRDFPPDDQRGGLLIRIGDRSTIAPAAVSGPAEEDDVLADVDIWPPTAQPLAFGMISL